MESYPFRVVTSGEEARRAMDEEPFDILVSDIYLGDDSGLQLLDRMKSVNSDAEVVIMTAHGSMETAVHAVHNGAFDYISKPFVVDEMLGILHRIEEKFQLVQGTSVGAELVETMPDTEIIGATPKMIEIYKKVAKVARIEAPAETPAGPVGSLIGRTAPMLEVYKHIAYAADSTAPVLIVGESGSGKELVARAIHSHSKRSREPFVAINCGAIADTLLESELFGHQRGSFTGAVSDHKGVFEQAGAGTVMLDEIGDTTAALQVRLLRVLEEGEVRPVGGSRSLRVSARVIAATNMPLEQAVAEGRFRQDLYYRLGVIVIRVPPLRDRRADIPLLIGSFLDDACKRAGQRRMLSTAALDALLRHTWPGNVRELRNTIERLVVSSHGSLIEAFDLTDTVITPPAAATGGQPFSDLPTLDDLERRYLLHVLEAANGNRTRAAEILGVDRRTLYRMAERFGIALTE